MCGAYFWRDAIRPSTKAFGNSVAMIRQTTIAIGATGDSNANTSMGISSRN